MATQASFHQPGPAKTPGQEEHAWAKQETNVRGHRVGAFTVALTTLNKTAMAMALQIHTAPMVRAVKASFHQLGPAKTRGQEEHVDYLNRDVRIALYQIR